MDEDQMTLARIEQQLAENLRMTEETHRLVRHMRRTQRTVFWLRILVWALVIILPLLFFQSIIDYILPVTGNSSAGVNLFGLPSPDSLQKAIDAYSGSGQ